MAATERLSGVDTQLVDRQLVPAVQATGNTVVKTGQCNGQKACPAACIILILLTTTMLSFSK